MIIFSQRKKNTFLTLKKITFWANVLNYEYSQNVPNHIYIFQNISGSVTPGPQLYAINHDWTQLSHLLLSPLTTVVKR